MKYRFTICLAAVLLIRAVETFAVESSNEFQSKLALSDSSSLASVQVVRLRDKKILFDHNSGASLVPASVVKLVLSSYLLRKLGPYFTSSTDFFYLAKRTAKKAHGNLYVRGGGDPNFVTESATIAAIKIKAMGFEEFTGDLVVDVSLFSDQAINSARSSIVEQASHAYDAGVTAFGLNFNTVAVNISPGPVGKLANVSLDPFPIPSVHITNNLQSKSTATKKLQVLRERVGTSSYRTELIVNGEISVADPLRTVYRSTNAPIIHSGETLQAIFASLGLKVHGRIKVGNLPKDAHLIYSHPSRPLSELIKGLNLYSNNYVADTLLKLADATVAGHGSYAGGVKRLRAYLQDLVGGSKFKLFDGSGLSSHNRLCAADLVTVLADMAKDFKVFPEFISSLPVAGKNGTLSKRFTAKLGKGALLGQIRAKTGSMNNPVAVSSLAGYIEHPLHGLLAFAILQNGRQLGRQPSVLEMRKRQEYALMALLNN